VNYLWWSHFKPWQEAWKFQDIPNTPIHAAPS